MTSGELIDFLDNGPRLQREQRAAIDRLQAEIERCNLTLVVLAVVFTLAALLGVVIWGYSGPACRCQRIDQQVLFVDGGGR